MLESSFLYFVLIVGMVILALIVFNSSYMDEYRNLNFLMAIICNILVFVGYIGREIGEVYHIIPLSIVATTLTYMTGMSSAFFLVLSARRYSRKTTVLLWSIECLNLLLAITSPFTGLYFTIFSTGVYTRGVLYVVPFILGGMFMGFWLIILFSLYKDVAWIDKFHIISMAVLEIFSIAFESFVGKYKLEYIGGSFLLAIYYAFLIETEGKYDTLTGVYTANYYTKYTRKKGTGGYYSVIMFDANGLKGINDRLGHESGDKLLSAIGQNIKIAVNSKGKVFRAGGDEFVALVNLDKESDLRDLIGRIEKLFEYSSKELNFEVSAASGYSIHIVGEDYAATLKRADKQMYQNKALYYQYTGKDRRK